MAGPGNVFFGVRFCHLNYKSKAEKNFVFVYSLNCSLALYSAFDFFSSGLTYYTCRPGDDVILFPRACPKKPNTSHS